MIDRNTLSRMLVLDEANKKYPYMDTVGKWTIGVGRNLTDKGVSQDEVMLMLDNDIAEVETELSVLPWFTALDDMRKLVISDMAFNLGMPTLKKFGNMIGALRIGDFQIAADEMLDSKWARQVGKRAERLAYMMRTGEIHPAYLA